MPHSPPVPPANQSPYPLAEKRHDETGNGEPASAAGKDTSPPADGAPHSPRELPAAKAITRNSIGAFLAIAALGALVAGLTFKHRPEVSTPPKKKMSRKHKR
ncbi:hypothetical protein FHS94_003717 [Sphingomonas aerophila]|uniref:Uncharacterized protein n=1 Tax=Sphingomonas aerophila TaxID=1344948 RepID=A0A7W9BGK3_9SPHN|nr:hypothetical protein [Sphingomonas aerophila]